MSSPMFFEQPIVIFDTTQASNLTTGSFVVYGGLSVNATYQSNNASSGAFILAGGVGIGKNLNVGGNSNIAGIQSVTNTTQSTSSNNGALVVAGGAGIAKDLNVGGDAFIAGNLFVNGTTTSINTTTVNVTDNTFLLNSGPAGSRDAGVVIQRYQVDNNTGDGDVVDPTEPVAFAGQVAGGSTTTIEFDNTASIVDDFYKGWWVKVLDGSAVDNVRQITAYDGTTKIATLSSALTSAPSNAGPDSFNLYNRNYVAQYYDESNNQLAFGYTSDVTDIQTSIQSSGYADIVAKGVFATNSTVTNLVVTNLSSGSISLASANFNSINVTGDSTFGNLYSSGLVLGGALTVSGGSILSGGLTTGSIEASSISASSIQSTTASILFANITQSATMNNIIVSGDATFGSAVTIQGAAVLNGGVTTGSILSTAITTGAILATTMASTYLNVSSGATFGNNVFMSGNLSVGGDIVFDGVDVTPSAGDIVRERSFSAANNQTSPVAITDFNFNNTTVRAFDAVVSVSILTTGDLDNKYAFYNLKGMQKNGVWTLNSSFVGDVTGITFTIDTTGQVNYLSTDVANFISDTMKFRALTTSV